MLVITSHKLVQLYVSMCLYVLYMMSVRVEHVIIIIISIILYIAIDVMMSSGVVVYYY